MEIIDQGHFAFTVSPDGIAEIRGTGHIDTLRKFIVERYKEFAKNEFTQISCPIGVTPADICDT